MLRIAWITVAILLAWSLLSQAQTQTQSAAKAKSAPAKTTTSQKAATSKSSGGSSKTAAKSTPAGASTKSGRASAKTRRTRSVRSATYRASQQTPTQERYTEIQKALAARGFFDGEPNGIWDDKSVAALKRFEAEQSLTPDGKLDSLSLIALGLGPSRGPYVPPEPPKLSEPIGTAPPPKEPPVEPTPVAVAPAEPAEPQAPAPVEPAPPQNPTPR